MAGLTKSELMDVALGEPHEIRAHEDAVRMDVFFGENEQREVTLTPRHILKIRAMYEDWWESHWAERHEADA